MKKKIALTVACLFLLSSAAFAAPLTDYTKGKASVDLNYRSTKNTIDFPGGHDSFESKYNFETSITYGVADKWAIQYRNTSAQSGDHVNWPGETATLTVNEFNALYSLTPQVSAFAGYVSAKGTYNAYGVKYPATKNTWQLGLLASVPLAEKVSAYGVVGAGGNWVNYEIGVSYAFTPNWEFNVDYRHIKAKDLKEEDYTSKGLGFGVTYKFN